MEQNYSTQKSDLRLLSINEARKTLGIRRGNLMKLIREKKLISKNIGSRIYVPQQSIVAYISSFDNDDSNTSQALCEKSIKMVTSSKRESSMYQTMKSRIKT